MFGECCGLESSPLVSINLSLSLICGLLISSAVVFWLNRSNNLNLKLNLNETYRGRATNACTSPECIRCSSRAGTDVLKRARDRLSLCKVEAGVDVGADADARAGAGAGRTASSLWHHTSSPKGIVHGQQPSPTVFYIHNLGSQPWFDSIYEDDVRTLRDNFSAIKREFTRVYNEDLRDCWSTNEVQSGGWNTFYFYNQGKRVSGNCDSCEQTTAVLDSLSNSAYKNCSFGNALFSVLQPGTVVTEHCGPTNARVRCHLGLQVSVGCELVVAGKLRKWEEGECLMFDDSYPHSAHHSGPKDSGPRVVLMIDFWHPHLNLKERELLTWCFNPVEN